MKLELSSDGHVDKLFAFWNAIKTIFKPIDKRILVKDYEGDKIYISVESVDAFRIIEISKDSLGATIRSLQHLGYALYPTNTFSRRERRLLLKKLTALAASAADLNL